MRQRFPAGGPADHTYVLLASVRAILAKLRDRLGPATAGASRSGRYAQRTGAPLDRVLTTRQRTAPSPLRPGPVPTCCHGPIRVRASRRRDRRAPSQPRPGPLPTAVRPTACSPMYRVAAPHHLIARFCLSEAFEDTPTVPPREYALTPGTTQGQHADIRPTYPFSYPIRRLRFSRDWRAGKVAQYAAVARAR